MPLSRPTRVAVRNLLVGAAFTLLGVLAPVHDFVRGTLVALGLAIVFAGLLVLFAGARRR